MFLMSCRSKCKYFLLAQNLRMHRPTFFPAVGGASQSGNLASFPSGKVLSRDLPTQGRLKKRRAAQDLNVPESLISSISAAPSLASLVKFDE